MCVWLPAGDYELTIHADGDQPIAKHYAVKPGMPIYFKATELSLE